VVFEDNQPNRELFAIGWNRKASKLYPPRIWRNPTPRFEIRRASCSPARCATWPGGWPILGQVDQDKRPELRYIPVIAVTAQPCLRIISDHRGGVDACVSSREFQIARRTAERLLTTRRGFHPAINHARPPGLITPLGPSHQMVGGKLASANFSRLKPATGRLADPEARAAPSTEA